MFGVVSITQPAATNIAIINKMSKAGFSVSEVTEYTNPWGTPMIASASAKGAENAIMGKITPFTLADPINIAGKSASVKLRRMKPIAIVTTTAVAPASVGVRRPEKIP